MIQEAYQDTHEATSQSMNVDKGKQREGVVQDEEVFLYKPYKVSSKPNRLRTSEPIFIQEEIDNLEKALKMLQFPIKTVLFYLPPYYKTFWRNEEQDEQY